jgi:alpha-ketoglutarate-dependent taurine dioxygenase
MKNTSQVISPSSIKRVPYTGQSVSPAATSLMAESLPFSCIRANKQQHCLLSYAKENRAVIKRKLHSDGAILFRGFEELAAQNIRTVLDSVCEVALEYKERSSPRTEVSEKIYTSTDYPNHQRIFFHNENAYQATWPKIIMFYCSKPSAEGGQTPVADIRKVLARIPQEIKERFHKKKIKYVRNFSPNHGMSWETVFQEMNKNSVEEYCRKNGVKFCWKSDIQLETQAVREAILRHPETQELVWFNHAAFFHISTLGKELSKNLADYFGLENLPSHTFYGDGEPIEDEVVDMIRNAYEAEKITFDWQKNDVLLLDNMLFAHSRETYKGDRVVWVGMGDLGRSEDNLVSEV